MNKWRRISLIILTLIFFNILFCYNVNACKDIVACGDATNGDYNLLMKVRDPSRLGLQVLCIVPKGYEYTYYNPWTGKPINFKNNHKYIGVASQGDTIPNIVKSGMSLSDVGIAYGDADTKSGWINPTKNAWDDFDWIRYACEKANNVDEAVTLMTKDVVDKMHAIGVSENLFIVGPDKGVVIEADAYQYNVKEIENGIVVMSNYPKELWKSQITKKLPIAKSFDNVVEKYVRNKAVLRLNSVRGIRVVEIGENYVCVKPVSFFYAAKSGMLGVIIKIEMGERKTVADFSVELLDIKEKKAKIRLCTKNKAWEEEMLDYIQPRYGDIEVKDMIFWSRLHSEDLDGLRGMCQDERTYEGVTIYKIPAENFQTLSSGWFAPNRACSTIYVPFHICNTDIYEPYETGEAAELSLNLFYEYGHITLNYSYYKTEEVLLHETEIVEQIAKNYLLKNQDVSEFLTTIDMSMQKQGYLTEEIWMESSTIDNQKNKEKIIDIIGNIWDTNYTNSLNKMKTAIVDLKEIDGSSSIREKILIIAIDICKSRINAANSLGKDCNLAEKKYNSSIELIKEGDYSKGFDNLINLFYECNLLIQGKENYNFNNTEISNKYKFDSTLFILMILFIIGAMLIITSYIKSDKK